MRKRVMMGIILLSGMIVFSLFGSGVKSALTLALGEETPGYVCNEEGLCATCVIEGAVCQCGGEYCNCGDNKVPIDECII